MYTWELPSVMEEDKKVYYIGSPPLLLYMTTIFLFLFIHFGLGPHLCGARSLLLTMYSWWNTGDHMDCIE